MSDQLHGTPSPEEVRTHLQAVLAGRSFANATRARRFLTYVVEQTLAGQTDAIKELVLGIEVFDRPADFDPKIDPIVRVEAGKLRKRLEEYYAEEGAGANLRIEVPKGSYVAQFTLRAQAPPAPETPAARSPRLRYAIALLAVVVIAGAAWGVRHFRAPAPIVSPSIAVLPFLNLSTDPANEYFADGLTEELTDALCNAGGLRVAARTSAFFFKGRPADIREVGTKLRVAFVLEGSVRKQGEQLKVTAQLIRTEDGYHVWSGSFERQLSDIFKVQQELASSLVNTLQVKMTGTQTRRLRKTHTASQQAFDLYLQGKHALNSFAPDSMPRAEALFQQAIAVDPAYPLPYIGLAQVYGVADIMGARPGKELAAKSNTAIQRALELDAELPDAHVMLGTIAARHQYDWPAAERHLRHALEINPSAASAHYGLAHNVFAPQERWPEALAESRLAGELDPLSPIIAMSEPWLAYLQRRNEAAVQGFRRLSEANPSDMMALGGLAFALVGQEDYPAALRTLTRLQSAQPSPQTLAFIGWVHARQGNPGEARKILQQLLADSRHGQYVQPGCFSVLYAGLGDATEFFRSVEQGREQQESYLMYTRLQNTMDPFRKDPRYQ
ncbi:MAG TPA: tetratricopeptide repeat protein, partial [Candidatus Acidoferrum sp.]|nr:tetratricopeptide repeat protein [Candidatus Acidoferrum sp.]